MENINLIKVSTSDYEVLYANGVLIFEDDSLNLNEVLSYLEGKSIDSYSLYYIDNNIIEEKYGWCFPIKFERFDREDFN